MPKNTNKADFDKAVARLIEADLTDQVNQDIFTILSYAKSRMVTTSDLTNAAQTLPDAQVWQQASTYPQSTALH